jgi:hypothetical protein
VTAARSPKSLSVQPKSAIMSGLRIAIIGRSMALNTPATHSTVNSDQRRRGVMTVISNASLRAISSQVESPDDSEIAVNKHLERLFRCNRIAIRSKQNGPGFAARPVISRYAD